MHKYKLRQVPRFFGTNWCAIVVPIQVIRWYRQCYDGTDSCAIVVQIRRYCHYRLSCLQRCISFESYIKPQPLARFKYFSHVVYLLNPTSNHNFVLIIHILVKLYIFLNPTSNHNCQGTLEIQREVVYLLNPTSNHNQPANASEWVRLYIF